MSDEQEIQTPEPAESTPEEPQEQPGEAAAGRLARHTAEDESALTARLRGVERAFWDRTAADARAGSLGDLLAEAALANAYTAALDPTLTLIESCSLRD